MTDLQALAAKVEAAEGPSRELDAFIDAFHAATGIVLGTEYAKDAYTFYAAAMKAARLEAVEHCCAVVDAHAEYDQRLCCDGRDCCCHGATAHVQMQHFMRQGALRARAAGGGRTA